MAIVLHFTDLLTGTTYFKPFATFQQAEQFRADLTEQVQAPGATCDVAVVNEQTCRPTTLTVDRATQHFVFNHYKTPCDPSV